MEAKVVTVAYGLGGVYQYPLANGSLKQPAEGKHTPSAIAAAPVPALTDDAQAEQAVAALPDTSNLPEEVFVEDGTDDDEATRRDWVDSSLGEACSLLFPDKGAIMAKLDLWEGCIREEAG